MASKTLNPQDLLAQLKKEGATKVKCSEFGRAIINHMD